ncbi:hypothetical protein NE237_020433 [Protea cynaroides]|uniref:Protein CHUP1, chloroplastic n=1 Tax=Protea cynaroides TaxID=273540 RepID=A0A9Q0H6M5_9MAGN|nr:hypothetical protein NE237_020433 [Protea cynaroides]
MTVRLGFLVTALVAVYAVKQISIKSLRPAASTTKYSENGKISSKQDQNEKGEKEHFIDFSSTTVKEHGEKVSGISNAKSSNSKNPLAFHDEKEPILLKYHYPEKNQVKELEGRKVKIERKLLKSYKLKEQESELDELQRHLKIRTAEIEMPNITINSLQEERKKLQEEIEKGVSAMKQLELAKRKIRSQIVTQGDAKADKNVKILEILELKILELKRKNKELQLEKRDLTLKLIVATSKITAKSSVTASEVVSEMEEEVNNLKIANEDLSKQVERIQRSMFSVVEELVYQRWVNVCLRHEIQNHQRFSMGLGPKTQEKVKKVSRVFYSGSQWHFFSSPFQQE